MSFTPHLQSEGLITKGAYNRNRKRASKKTINSSAEQYTSCIYWFLIKLQKVLINRIHFDTS